MGKWQDSAKQSIVNRNSDTASQSNTTTAGAKSSGTWQQQAKQSLDSRGYVAPENRMYEIKIDNGRNFGTVSYGAYKAIQNNTLDKYKPKNDDEKRTLDDFLEYVNEQTDKQEKVEKQKRINSNPVTKKYGIDPDSFMQKDFEKWAEEHGFEYRMGGNDLTGTEMKWLPKQKGGLKFWEVVPSKEEQSDKKALEALAENNSRKAASKTDKGAVSAAVVNAIDGLTFGAVNAYADWDAKRDYKKAGFDEDSFVSYTQAQTKTNSEHKIASAVGNIAGSLVSLGGLSKAVGAATSSVKWIAKAPGWVQSAINSGITFAVQNGAETAFDGGNFEDVLKSAGINLVGGAVGGGVSGKVGSIGEKLLFDKGLQHKVIPEMIRTGVSSATFAGGKTASTYFLYPEDYRPTKEEMEKDITTAFAFGAISSGINTIKTSSQNKKYLDGLYQKMAADYESMAKANISGKDDTAGIQKFAKNVIGYSNAMEAYLTGKEYNATIDGETYTFTPNKIRLVGQDKYVNSILGEIDTIRNNANAVLNGIGTPSASVTPTSANTSGMSAGAIAQAASKAVPYEEIASAESASSNAAVNVAAAETAVQKSVPTVNKNIPKVDTKSGATGELGEIMDSEPIATFTPETASNEIKRLENILIAKGADDTSRKEIIDTAVEIEKTLDGSDKNIRSVFNDVSKITSTAISEIQSQAGLSSAYWRLFGENFKTVPTGNAKGNINLVTEYSNAYAEALKNNNPEKYNAVMLSADGKDLSAELPNTVLQNVIPNSVQNAGQYRLVATQIKNIINAADIQIENERNEIYGESSVASVKNNVEVAEVQTVAEPKNITLMRMGDFYEAFGDEALELAEKLKLTPTYKAVNGVKTAMVGFPVHVLEKYQSTLGNGYNLVISDNTVNTIAGNTPVTAQNQAVSDETSVIDHTKAVEGMKLVDAEKSTLLDGKTLVTGVYELNSDKDFNRKSYKKEKFDVFLIEAPYVKSVEGTTYGHYGTASSKTNGYVVTYLPAGVGVAKADTQNKAKSLMKALESELPELPLTIKAYVDEYRCYGINEEVKASVKQVVDSVSENADEITLPLKNKKELISYLKNHKGGSIGVTYNNGTEEVKTIVSVSDTAIVTESADGQKSRLSAKANELSYTDNGFVYTGSNGMQVSYRFISDNTSSDDTTTDTETETPENVIKKADTVTETPESKHAVFYTDKEKQNWENSNNIIVYENDEQFENFVEKVLKNEDTHKKIYFGKIPTDTAQMILDKTGVDVSEHNIALKGYEIRKILLNSHGDEKLEIARGQEPITVDDLKKIPSVIANPDDVKLSDKKYEGKPALLFEKNIDGKNYVVAYVSRKHHDIAIQTMYKKRSLATAENANALSSTSETTSSTASDNIVSQNNDIVNSSVRNVSENDTLNLTDKCELIATKHTATEDDIWVVTLKDRLTSEEYKDLNGKVKSVGGYYSKFAKTPDGEPIPGFVFKSEPTAKELKVFNDFFADGDKNVTENPQTSDKNVIEDDNTEIGKQTNGDKLLKNNSESDIIEESTDKDGVKNVKSQSEILGGKNKNDGRGLHAGASKSDVETRNEEADGTYRKDSGKGLSESVGTDGNRPDVGNDSERVHGTDDVADASNESTGNSAEITDSELETVETEVKTIEKKRPSNKGNFVITDDIATKFDNTPPNTKDNIEAIELLLTLENEGRAANAEEKKALAKYKGWGGIDTRYLPYELSSRLGKLFDWEQRKAMQSSQNNAFFTPTKVIDAMYTGLKRMGFKGGNVLETSMGIGNFFGRMPRTMSAKSVLTGVELEAYTARIAQYLYPGATVINKPFQDVAIKNGSYDLVIGNVPFGQNKISYNKKKYSLHNYFIVSSLDKVRDGGIVAVITSAGTLDSHSIDARKAIMDRADVVACYKLPEKVFSRNASTDVQSDLLILRKRASDENPKGDSILNTITTKQGFRINEYFNKHPENILGTLTKGTNAWGEITTVQGDGNFYDKLNTAMKKLPKDLISGKVELKPIETIVSLSDKPRFFEENDKVYADDGAGTATEVSKNQANTVRDYIAVRDAYKELLNAYDNGEVITNDDGTVTIREMSDEDIKPLRDALSKVYDDFYEKHGAITGDGKKKIGTKKSTNNTFLEADADYYLVGGLERYDAENSTFVKSALFKKDTLRKKRVTSVDVASDALAVSLNESGRIDFTRMQELTGKTEKQLAEELKGEIVLTPEGNYVLTDIYLSGNIYEKLEAVKDKPEFKEQREMLEKVIPTPKDASDITVKLGANYIDAKYIEQFAREIFNTPLTIRKDISGRWVIEGVRQSRYGDVVNVKYGCDAFNAVQLLEKILNDSEITATKKVGIGDKAVTALDTEMTDIARQKADDIRAAFEAWIFGDSERRTEIVDKYNRTYNNYRPLDYERIAEKLSFDSMDETLKAKLYPHQKKGIARFLFGGNILFAHGVGTGKTFEMIASVMEAKRMGIINKTAMVVPNNKVVDFKNDIAQAYPNAKVLVIDTANKKRQTMLGLVNSNDWDIVLIARTTFTKIPISPEFQTHYIAQQLEDLELQIAEAENDRSVSKRQLKGMITQRDNLEQKIKDLDAETKRDTNSVDFENLGIDCICVDEAHNYKSIMTPTKLSIKGLVNRNNAQMANDMLMKLDYLRSIDGKIIFGTGTPITNTVSEIYNMMRMVRPDILEDAGIHSLDEWVNTFAKIDTVTEIGIDNQIKNKSTQIIRSFINVSEMIGMFRQFADIVFTTDVVKNLPKAVYKDVELAGTDEHKQIEKQISEVIAKTKKSDLLKVYGQLMSMADAASVDLRMLSGAESEYNIFKDYSLDELDYKDSKINVMCNNVYDEYTASNGIKGTQIIFCDKGSGSGNVYSFNLHKDIMQKLVERGIPEEQIVIIKNQSDAQLEALYDKVNAGEVRVLIGTSQKMAEGLNVQKRVVAIHHPTVTYKPSDKEQGDARGVRAGNINDELRIYRYLQKNTFDSHKWQAQDRKGEMINKALRGEVVAEMEDIGADEDSGAGVDAATAMAITSGNPLVKEKIDIDKEVVRLKTLQRNYLSEVYRYQDAISKNPNIIRQLTNYADNIERDIALRNKYGEKASVIIKGKTFEKQTEANKALSEAVKTAPKNGQYTKLGTYNGFDIMFKGDTGGMGYSVVIKGSNEYTVDYAGNGNNMARFAGVLGRLDAELTRVRERVETLKTDLEFAKKEVLKPFEKEKELTEALENQKDITYRYEHYGEKTMAAENTEAEEIESTDTVHSSKDIADNDSVSRWTTERIEGNKDNNVNIADIVNGIRGKFGIPISTGKVTDREAAGIYKDKPETIRTRIANNLPTISHELGHHLDKKYDLSKLESVKKLCKVVSEEFLKQYPANAKNSEAVAEFVRIYLKNTNDANRLCPDFYSDFISTISEEDLKSLNEIASSVNEYLSYNISERYDAAVVSSQKKEKVPFKEKWHKWYSDWVDAFHPQKQAIDYVEDVTGQTLSGKNNAYILATNSLNAHTVANFLICEGFRDLDGNIVDAKSFVDSIGMVDSKNVQLLDKYLVLRHSLEWIAPEQEDVTAKRVFADDTLENIEEIKKQIAEIEKAHPEIKTAAENLYEYQNNVIKHFVIPAGGMTEETLSTLNRKYPSYVPFYRAVGKKSGFAKGTFANQRSPIMRAKGSGALIISPTESIIRNTEKMVKLAMRNQVTRMWANYADTVDGFGRYMEKVTPDMLPHTINITTQKERFTDALQQVVHTGEDYFAISDLFDEIFGDTVSDFTPIANANKRIVTVLIDGKPSYYQIHDEAFYNSIAELSPKQTSGMLKIVDSIMQPMKLLITQNNPIFAATNAIRDYGTAYKLSEINNPVTFANMYVKALSGIIANSESYKQYKAMGGGHSSELSANIDSIAKTLREVAQKDMGKARRLAYSIFRHPVETIASINDVIESTPRFMEFMRTLENGGDLQEAIYNADDITTNFKRSGKGTTAKAVNKSIMFNNAAIQGVDKMFRTLFTKDPKKRNKTLLKWVLHALLMGVIGYIYNKEVDEEGYKNLSSYKKNNFYNYAIGDGKFISLPKPRENAVLDTFTERTIEYLFSDNENAFYDFGSYVSSQLLPPMLPDNFSSDDEHSSIENAYHSVMGSTVLGGLTDVGFNQDFKGTPIEGRYEKYLPSNERYSENSTSKLAYELGQTKLARDNNLSPKKIDHLISSYTGILGQVNNALFPMNDSRRDTSIGLRNKFISDSNYSTDVLNRMDENQEKAEKAFNYSASVSDAVEYEKNSIITSYISGMNKAVKALPEDEQRNGRAYLLKTLNSWNYENTASQSSMLKGLDGSAVSKDAIFTELPSSSLEWTVDKQKYVYQMTPQEYHKYISDYMTAIENSRRQYGCNSVESCEKAKKAVKDYMSSYKKNNLKRQYFNKATKKAE